MPYSARFQTLVRSIRTLGRSATRTLFPALNDTTPIRPGPGVDNTPFPSSFMTLARFLQRQSRSLLALGMTTALASCGDKGTSGGGGENGGTVIVSMGADAATLYPGLVGDET